MSDACDFCHKNDTGPDDLVLFEGKVLSVCWRCRLGVPYDLMYDFVRSVLAGTSPRLAAMLVTQQTPVIHTNDTFGARWKRGGDQFADLPVTHQQEYVRHAKAAGVTVHGRQYMSGLAEYPGDPRAWVGSKDEAIAVLKDRGWGCDRLGVKAKVSDGPAKESPLGEDIVRRHMENYLQDVPKEGRTKKLLEETRERVIETHGRKKDSGAAGVHLPAARRKRKARTHQRA